jgi:glycosyltransferase involved in cell wall biosynthesis
MIGSVVVDLGDLGSPGVKRSRAWRGAVEFVAALEARRPDLVGRYLVLPGQRPPAELAQLLAGKTAEPRTPGSIPDGAVVFHTLNVLDLSRPLKEIWPPEVEHFGLAYSATVHDVIGLRSDSAAAANRRYRRRYRSRCEAFRQADALLAVSSATRRDLIRLGGADPSAVVMVGSGEPWGDVVARAAEVWEALACRGRRPWHRTSRLAFVSPFSPIASGVARYSSRLAEALSQELEVVAPGTMLDRFADALDRPPPDSNQPPHSSQSPYSSQSPDSSLPTSKAPAKPDGAFDARVFVEIDHAVGGYDRVVYVLGNSEFHSGALAALRRRGGTVMAHDVRMTGLLRLSSHRRGAVPGGVEGALRRVHGDELADELGAGAGIEANIEQSGLLLLGDIAAHADRVLVSSEAARRLAVAEVGPDFADRVSVVPFAMALEASELQMVAIARQRAADGPPLVISFGIVDPSKLPRVLVRAVAAVQSEPPLELAFVGPVSERLTEELTGLAQDLGIGARVHVTGHQERSAYIDALGSARVAVQLRAGFFGEASAAVGDCLAAGLPTVVSDIGWMGDLPDETVVKIDTSDDRAVERLAETLQALLDDPARRASLSEHAAEHAARQTFAQSAAALIVALELAVPPGSPAPEPVSD